MPSSPLVGVLRCRGLVQAIGVLHQFTHDLQYRREVRKQRSEGRSPRRASRRCAASAPHQRPAMQHGSSSTCSQDSCAPERCSLERGASCFGGQDRHPAPAGWERGLTATATPAGPGTPLQQAGDGSMALPTSRRNRRHPPPRGPLPPCLQHGEGLHDPDGQDDEGGDVLAQVVLVAAEGLGALLLCVSGWVQRVRQAEAAERERLAGGWQ